MLRQRHQPSLPSDHSSQPKRDTNYCSSPKSFPLENHKHSNLRLPPTCVAELFSWHFFGDHVVCSVISRWKLLDFSVIVLGFLGDFTLFNALLCGSNGLSARRVQRTKSRRPQGPKAGLRGRQLVFYNTASHQRGVGGLWGSNKKCFIGKVFVQWACRIILGFWIFLTFLSPPSLPPPIPWFSHSTKSSSPSAA